MNVYNITDSGYVYPQYIVIKGNVEDAIYEYKRGLAQGNILSVELVCKDARILGEGNK